MCFFKKKYNYSVPNNRNPKTLTVNISHNKSQFIIRKKNSIFIHIHFDNIKKFRNFVC